jgi:hypothetical protein
MTNGALVLCKSASMVEHSVLLTSLLSVPRPVLGLSSPAPNARLVHVEIAQGNQGLRLMAALEIVQGRP